MRSVKDFVTVTIYFPKEIFVTKLDPSFYSQIKEILLSARNKVYATANFAMVEAYWNIGKALWKNREEKPVQSTARGL